MDEDGQEWVNLGSLGDLVLFWVQRIILVSLLPQLLIFLAARGIVQFLGEFQASALIFFLNLTICPCFETMQVCVTVLKLDRNSFKTGTSCQIFKKLRAKSHFLLVFSVPRFELGQFRGKAKGHDINVADLQTCTIQPLEESPG